MRTSKRFGKDFEKRVRDELLEENGIGEVSGRSLSSPVSESERLSWTSVSDAVFNTVRNEIAVTDRWYRAMGYKWNEYRDYVNYDPYFSTQDIRTWEYQIPLYACVAIIGQWYVYKNRYYDNPAGTTAVASIAWVDDWVCRDRHKSQLMPCLVYSSNVMDENGNISDAMPVKQIDFAFVNKDGNHEKVEASTSGDKTFSNWNLVRHPIGGGKCEFSGTNTLNGKALGHYDIYLRFRK